MNNAPLNDKGGENKKGKSWNPNTRESTKSRVEPDRRRRITQHSNRESSLKPEGQEQPGQMLFNEKRFEEALEFYDRRLLKKPRNADLHVGKGEALLGLGRSKEALAAYEEAIRLAPELSEAYRGRGKVYEQLAQQVYEDLTQQAQECYEKAKQLGVG